MRKIRFPFAVFTIIVLSLIAINYPRIFNSSLFSSSSSLVDRHDKYKVSYVHDGDTLDVMIGAKKETIRLIGIDTPEVKDPRKVVQCFGREASNRAHQLLDGRFVYLETDPAVGQRDKYGRLLAYVFLEDGRNFNKLMVEDGYAHEYTYNSQAYKYQKEFKQAQDDAMKNQRGLWASSTCGGNTTQPAK